MIVDRGLARGAGGGRDLRGHAGVSRPPASRPRSPRPGPYVDDAVARVATAAIADGQAVVAISGFERVGECDVIVFRGGERYRRAVTALVAAGHRGGPAGAGRRPAAGRYQADRPHRGRARG